MTQSEFALQSKPSSQCDLIKTELERNAGKWVAMPRLVELSGSYVIHSRISDLRKRLRDTGRTIEQRSERVGGRCRSEYRLT